MSEAVLLGTVAAYYLFAILAGHLLHELVHVAAAYATDCRDIRVVWPHVYYTGGPLQRLTVALSPLVCGAVAMLAWAGSGPWLLTVLGVPLPHPVWFGLVTLGATWHDDLVVAKRILSASWQAARLVYRGWG